MLRVAQSSIRGRLGGSFLRRTASVPQVRLQSSQSTQEVLDQLFQEQQAEQIAAAESVSSTLWEPVWYNLSDQAILAVKYLHDISDLEYGWSIVGVTLIMRLALFPVMVSSQRTTSRMAHLQPELQLMKQRYEALGTPSRQDQLQFSKKIKGLFAKYEVKPSRAFAGPLIQLPLFMGMFFGLRKMPSIYPEELSTGGLFWFPDLTVPDPLYILPIASASTFLLLIELGKDQTMASNPASGHIMINVFRIMSIAMVPVCISFDSAILCYWTANNIVTLGQTALLKTPRVRKFFGIWDPPKPVPGLQAESLTEAATKLINTARGETTDEKSKIEQHNQVVDARKRARAFRMLRRKK